MCPKKLPDAGTFETNKQAPSADSTVEDSKQYSTLRAQLAIRGFSVKQEFVIRQHGHETVVVANIEALAAFVRGVL